MAMRFVKEGGTVARTAREWATELGLRPTAVHTAAARGHKVAGFAFRRLGADGHPIVPAAASGKVPGKRMPQVEYEDPASGERRSAIDWARRLEVSTAVVRTSVRRGHLCQGRRLKRVGRVAAPCVSAALSARDRDELVALVAALRGLGTQELPAAVDWLLAAQRAALQYADLLAGRSRLASVDGVIVAVPVAADAAARRPHIEIATPGVTA